MNLTENQVPLASGLTRGCRPQKFLADADISFYLTGWRRPKKVAVYIRQ
jgi:hypothetical protein